MTPILHLVLLRPQPQHGLGVPVEVVVKVVQQGSPCPVLQEGQRTQPGLQGRSSGSNPCDTSSCILRALPAPWSPCSRPQSTNPGQQGRVALRRDGRTPQTLLQAGTCGQCYLQLGKLVRLAAGVLSIDELGQQELPELGALQGEVENTHPCKILCISGTTALPTQNPSSEHPAVPPDVEALVGNPRWV